PTCNDAARKAAAATDDKPAQSWAKHMTRRTTTSYRLTLELSGGEAVRLERNVRRHFGNPSCSPLHSCFTPERPSAVTVTLKHDLLSASDGRWTPTTPLQRDNSTAAAPSLGCASKTFSVGMSYPIFTLYSSGTFRSPEIQLHETVTTNLSICPSDFASLAGSRKK